MYIGLYYFLYFRIKCILLSLGLYPSLLFPLLQDRVYPSTSCRIVSLFTISSIQDRVYPSSYVYSALYPSSHRSICYTASSLFVGVCPSLLFPLLQDRMYPSIVCYPLKSTEYILLHSILSSCRSGFFLLLNSSIVEVYPSSVLSSL